MSGTASLEVAYTGIPKVVVYKTSFLSFFIAKLLINVKFISLGLEIHRWCGLECAVYVQGVDFESVLLDLCTAQESQLVPCCQSDVVAIQPP